VRSCFSSRIRNAEPTIFDVRHFLEDARSNTTGQRLYPTVNIEHVFPAKERRIEAADPARGM